MLPNARFAQRCFINHWQLCSFKARNRHYANSTHDACAIANKFVDFKAENSHRSLPDELYFEPNFLSYDEQSSLLAAALRKLDSLASPRSRRLQKRRRLQSQRQSLQGENCLPNSVLGLFHADEDYDFEEGHYDGVIRNFREMHVTAWCPEDLSSISPIFSRLHSLVPKAATQTHVLHLGTAGEILPHVDNVEASGSWILGVSLGAERILRIKHKEDPDDGFDIYLPSGSVYIQRDQLRYNYKHSILLNAPFRGQIPTGGQRVSVMIRDKKHVL